MAFKPKKKKQEEEEEEENEEEEESPDQITRQEIRDVIEGHLNRATELFKQYM